MSRDKQIEERRDISDIIYWSGYGFDRGTCNDISKQIQEQGYRKASEGKWLTTTDRLCAIKCGACGETIDLDDGGDYLYWNYCPICGAKMKYESEGEG